MTVTVTGRPTVMTVETLQKLEEAFSNGASDKEAIFQANISSATFYSYCKAHPDFLERKEALKDQPKYRARKNVVKAIEAGNIAQSNWWLERKAKSEFSSRSEITGKDGDNLFNDDQKETGKQAVKAFGAGDIGEGE